ncbi:MAG: DUF4430 domain-containing protein [bacterium]|nr:DUF4430 domain-containing protein [bacterium]
MKKYQLLFVAIVVLGAGSYFTERQFLSYSRSSAITLAASLAAQGDTLAELNATSTMPAGIDFTLSADGKMYQGSASYDATVLIAMNTLASTSNFRFTSKDFPGMGTFVESINGKANEHGFYWILYVNGTSSQTGASQTPVRANDSLEWRYEKGY